MNPETQLNSKTVTKEQAIDLATGDYGKETLKQIANYVAPIFWLERTAERLEIRNGSMFFVDAGEGLFAVTASHVFEKYRNAKACSEKEVSRSQIGPNIFGSPGREAVPFDLESRLIEHDSAADIATFRVLREELDAVGSTILTAWPPMLPKKGLGIGFAGFPGQARRLIRPQMIEFGVHSALSVATEINDRLISCQVQREHVLGVPGFPPLPEQFEVGGLSGGPLLTHVEKNGISYWRLGGVIREGSATFEIIWASRADRLKADGTISPARL